MKLFKKKQTDIPRRRDPRYTTEKSSSVGVSYNHSFRRNRTLTGTTSNNINSVNVKSDLESDRVSVHHLSIKRRKVAGIFVIVFISLSFTWLLVSNLTARVSVSVTDSSISKRLEPKRYEEVIQNYLKDNPTSRLTFFLDQSALTNYVSLKLPEVSKVSVRGMDGIGGTKFVLTMREPIASWQINKKQYYVDSSGIAFERDYFQTPVVQIVDNSGIKVDSTATAIASKRLLSFVGRVVYLAKQQGYTVTKAALPADTTRQLEVTIKQGGLLFKLSIDRPAGEQVEDMAAAARFFNERNQHPQYVDVRVSGKAFYKY